jgi:uncharacterized membrane protein YkoI
MNSRISLSLTIYLVSIIISSNICSLSLFDNINAQITGNNTNSTITSKETTVIDSENQTQMAKMNPCLNLMNPGMMTVDAYNNIVGSLKIGKVLNNTFSQIKISLSKAATIAEKEIGNNSHAIEAYLCDANGYIVYMIWVRSPNANTIDAVVDPTNGKILLKDSNLLLQQNSGDSHMVMPGMLGINQ